MLHLATIYPFDPIAIFRFLAELVLIPAGLVVLAIVALLFVATLAALVDRPGNRRPA